MTEGIICGGRRHTWLTDVVVCSKRPLPCIYRWEREGSSKGVPQVGGILLGGLVQFGPPYHFHWRGKERGGRREGRGRPNPSPFLLPSPLSFSSGSAHMGGAAAPAGCCVSPLGPLGPYLLPGVRGTPSGDPICTRYPPEHFRCPNTIVLYINLYLSTI